jgi:uncharacterized membrane protein YqiK
MGLAIMVLGAALIAAGFAAPLGLVEKFVLWGFGFVVLIGGAFVAAYTKLYRKTSADQAFVRTGRGGSRVVMDGGDFVVPYIHQVNEVNLQTMKLGVNPKGRNALITKDNLRADVLAQFYIKVQPDEEHILTAARSLGKSSVNAVTVEELVSEKLVSALRAIASQMDLFEIHTRRDEFAEKVKEHVRADLEENGLLLESVTISELDQTDPAELSDNNVFDAQGKKKITEITAAALVERNKLEREAERLRKDKDVETRQQVLELERKQAEAEAAQAAEVAKIKAAKAREAQEAEILRQQAIATAQVAQEQAVRQAEIARDLALETANIQRDRQLIQREQERQQTDIERAKAVELAERQKQIAVAEQEAARARAEEASLLAQAERERASQQVVTVQQLAEADREANKKLIAAKQVIEQDKIKQQTEAEVQAFTRVKQAEGEQEAAAKQATARRQLAEAEADAKKLVAEGEAAQQMVPVQVERERVNVKQAEVAVEAQALENRQKFAEAGIELEIQRLRITADKEVQIAMAEAIGMALSSSKMTLFGSPEMASTMLQSMAKGMGVRTMIEGFTGGGANGHPGPNGEAPANPLASLAEVIAPVVERFTGKPVDTPTVEAVVRAALEAERARTAPPAVPAEVVVPEKVTSAKQ